MKRAYGWWLVVMVLGARPIAAQSLAEDPRVSNALRLLETWADAQVAYDGIPGASMAVVRDQTTLWSRGFGYADRDKKTPVTPSTIFRICSMSKLFTSIAVMQLRDRGRLRLDDPVAKHLPWFTIKQTFPGAQPTTIEGLLSHTSGLPREAADFAYWSGPEFPFPTHEQIRERISSQAMLYPAETVFQYSNLGLTLAGEIVAEISKQPFADYVTQNILVPLGMKDTRPDLSEKDRGDRVATGYSARRRDGSRNVMPFRETGAVAPAGGFASTAEDFARFASWQLRLLQRGGEEVLNANNYAVVGSFDLSDNGSPAMTDFGQAGLEFDCAGRLWAIDQNTQTVYNVDSGETAGCSVDIPWFTPSPTEGTLTANGGTQDINGHFDGAGLLPGLRLAQVQVKTNTPVAVPNIPVTLVVRFLDVPDSNQFEAYIYGAAGAGIMFGGPPNCPAGILSFCPASPVTRADMAGYIFRAMHGKNTPPPVYQNVFGDVTFNDYNSFYIQGIFDDGITAGCGGGNYCPNQNNTRAQMSVFVVKALEGADFVPPPATGIFNDVPANDQFAPWIEYLYNQGVTAGCGGGNFCPTANISNGQMAVFLVKAFNVPHL